MRSYRIPLVPGPTSVPNSILAAHQLDYGSPDSEPEFILLYQDTQQKLQKILNTRNEIAIMSGEAMIGLWGALKSSLIPGDRVLSIATGVFGYSIAEMARTITPDVEVVGFEYNEIADPDRVEQALEKFRPKMITMVHCETPSGTLNPVAEIGALVQKYDIPLFYVDAVSSAGGVELRTDDRNIDLCLVGTQKCLSAPPDFGIVSVSEHAWDIIKQVNYQGYDALLPFRTAVKRRWFPYTHNWHAMAVLNAACARIINSGIEQILRFHQESALFCRRRIQESGLRLFPKDESFSSPSVTAVLLPQNLSWVKFDAALREHGLVVGGSFGKLAGKIFRIGHMGTQADRFLVEQGLDVIDQVLQNR